MIQCYLNAHPVLRKATTKCISMAWYCSGSTNAELVDNLFKAGLVKNERVKEAMLGVSGSLNFLTPHVPCHLLTLTLRKMAELCILQ